jgi:hypothetical protein
LCYAALSHLLLDYHAVGGVLRGICRSLGVLKSNYRRLLYIPLSHFL